MIVAQLLRSMIRTAITLSLQAMFEFANLPHCLILVSIGSPPQQAFLHCLNPVSTTQGWGG